MGQSVVNTPNDLTLHRSPRFETLFALAGRQSTWRISDEEPRLTPSAVRNKSRVAFCNTRSESMLASQPLTHVRVHAKDDVDSRIEALASPFGQLESGAGYDMISKSSFGVEMGGKRRVSKNR